MTDTNKADEQGRADAIADRDAQPQSGGDASMRQFAEAAQRGAAEDAVLDAAEPSGVADDDPLSAHPT